LDRRARCILLVFLLSGACCSFMLISLLVALLSSNASGLIIPASLDFDHSQRQLPALALASGHVSFGKASLISRQTIAVTTSSEDPPERLPRVRMPIKDEISRLDEELTHETSWLRQSWPSVIVILCIVSYIIKSIASEYFKDVQSERALFSTLAGFEIEGSVSRGKRQGFVETLDYIRIDRDGGLEKIGKLEPLKFARIAQFLVLVGSVVFNIACIFYVDWDIMDSSRQRDDVPDGPKDPPVHRIQRYIARHAESEVAIVSLNLAFCVAICEVAALSVLIVMTLHELATYFILRYRNDKAFDAFLALFEFANLISWLATFSAIKLIACCHPSLIGRMFLEHMSHPYFGNSQWAQCVQAVWFAVTRIGAGLLGCLAFAVKLAITSIYLYVPMEEHPERTWHHTLVLFIFNWIVVIALLIHCLNAVDLDLVLRWRVFLLLAGGSDGEVDRDENVMLQVYCARIMQVMQEDFLDNGRSFAFWVLALTFRDQDLQYLIVKEDDAKKDEWRKRCSVLRQSSTSFTIEDSQTFKMHKDRVDTNDCS